MNLMKTRECTGQDKNRKPKWMRTCSNHLYSPKLCKNLKQGLQMIQKLLVHHLSNTKERIVTLSHETISVAQINNSSNNNYFYIDQQGKENDLQVYFVSSKNKVNFGHPSRNEMAELFPLNYLCHAFQVICHHSLVQGHKQGGLKPLYYYLW